VQRQFASDCDPRGLAGLERGLGGARHGPPGEHGLRVAVGLQVALAHVRVAQADARVQARQVDLDAQRERPGQVAGVAGDLAVHDLGPAVERLQRRLRGEGDLAAVPDAPGRVRRRRGARGAGQREDEEEEAAQPHHRTPDQ